MLTSLLLANVMISGLDMDLHPAPQCEATHRAFLTAVRSGANPYFASFPLATCESKYWPRIANKTPAERCAFEARHTLRMYMFTAAISGFYQWGEMHALQVGIASCTARVVHLQPQGQP